METSLEPIYKTHEVHDCGKCEPKLAKQVGIVSATGVGLQHLLISPGWYPMVL